MPDEAEDLARLMRAGHPVIAIESTDEPRAEQVVEEASAALGRPMRVWSTTQGLIDADRYSLSGATVTHDVLVKPPKAEKVLEWILQQREKAVYLFRDLAPHCKDATVARLLRDFARYVEGRGDAAEQSVIMVESTEIPREVGRLVVRHDIGWPNEDEILAVVKEVYRRMKRQSDAPIRTNLKKAELEAVVQSLRGLSRQETARLVASVIHDDHSLTIEDLPRLVEGKRKLLRHTGSLETIAPDVKPDDIGGLDNLKNWLKRRRKGFGSEAREFGLEPPRGLLLLGVPGCGKSLCAKVVAADWHMPLLRLDPGQLYTKFIGESEGQLRRALRQAESMAPCVLWIDEIEKAFASASASSSDGGLSKRMFGSLLSWMQDHRHPIFLVATANDISALPPELMRKGRFDEVFFVDLPDACARAQILGIHLKRRGRDPKEFDLTALAAKAENFSGSELEQVVLAAMFDAFEAGEALANAHLEEAILMTRPLATLTAEKVTELRSWAEDRCVPAD